MLRAAAFEPPEIAIPDWSHVDQVQRLHGRGRICRLASDLAFWFALNGHTKVSQSLLLLCRQWNRLLNVEKRYVPELYL